MSVRTAAEWRTLTQSLQLRRLAFIDGKFVPSQSGETFRVVNPATEELLTEVAACGPTDVDLAVSAARRVFDSGKWSEVAPVERKRVLLRLAELLRTHAEEFALIDSLDMGKPVLDALNIDVSDSADLIQWYAEAIDKMYDEIAPSVPGVLATITRNPIGVVGAVVAWNFPLNNAVWKVAPALAAGNSVVLKPAEQAPLSVLRFAELAMEAGLPAGVFNVVPGFGETAGKAIGLHDQIDTVCFTGSTPVGKMFMGYAAASNMKQVWLECGGKSPCIIFDDCRRVDEAVERLSLSIFGNQGEICSAHSRLIVHRSLADEVLEKLSQRAHAMRPGDPLEPESLTGAMVDGSHTARVMDYITSGKNSARLVCGGDERQVNGAGFFINPTIFETDNPKERLFQEEIFGPVLTAIIFDTEEQAVDLANNSVYGLSSSLWTDSFQRAHSVAKRIKAGTVAVNAVDALSAQTPFGGVKQSGFGRDLSLHGLEKYSNLKTSWFQYN